MNLRSAVHRVHERVVSYLIRVVTWRSIGATMCAMTEQEQYDAVAEDYDRLIRPRYDAIAALVVDRVREVTDVASAHVVELAAGTGALTHQLAPLARDYTATDISQPMLAVARRRDVPGCERVTWLRGDVLDLPLETASADVVVSSLGPLQDSEEALGEARRVLRRGGHLVAVTWGDDYRELELLRETRQRLGLPPRATLNAEELAARVTGTGFRAATVRDVRMPVVHDSLAAYVAYRGAFGPIPDLVTADPDATVRALSESAAAYVDEGGRVVLDWQLLVVSAER